MGIFSTERLITGGVILLFILGIWWYHNDRTETIEKLNQKVTQLTAEATIKENEYKTNLKTLTDTIAEQNVAVEQANQKQQEASIAAANAVDQANQGQMALRESTKQNIQLIKQLKKVNTCDEAMKQLVTVGEANKWSTEKLQ